MIPRPNRIEPSPAPFLLGPSTAIVARGSEDARWTAVWLAELLERTAGIEPEVTNAASASANAIVLEIAPLRGSQDGEAYRLDVSPERITVTANRVAGLLYGAVTVWQLATAGPRQGDAIRIPAVTVIDEPRFAWRGLMLDSARHYVRPDFIERMIDWMALHKLNVLHWHLTDDQGWRLQIDAYPRLTSVGAWRVPAGAAAADNRDPETGEPRRYGGFYTKDEVRDIVAYAARRQVTIVPEIEMPGHAQAAIAAYPELGVGEATPDVPADWGIHTWLFGVGEDTFAALETILTEVLELFPGRYIHVGGDEAVKTQWIESERVQARMRELGLEDETALQSWFVKRIERFLEARGRRLIGWDEILEGGIAPRATVMSWRGIDGALEAASLGHDTVLTPWPTLYFDHRQSPLASEPPGRGLVVSLEDVYRFEPMPDQLAPDERRHVLGIQANLWSEHIRTEDRVARMAFPRAAALAEVAWSQPDRTNWHSFLSRLPAQFARYRSLGIPFATSAFDLRANAEWVGRGKVKVELSNLSGAGEIRYTTDGSRVTVASARYSDRLQLLSGTQLAARTFLDGRAVSRELRGEVGRMANRRASQDLELCTSELVLSLEDDAPLEGQRAVFFLDIMNPCWLWRDVDLDDVSAITAAVGQVPFNFQFGADRPEFRLVTPQTPEGELEVRANGCDGERIAVLPLGKAARRHDVSVLSAELAAPPEGTTDLCFRFTASDVDPLWAIDWVALSRAARSEGGAP
ncbi:MAG: family 20 glycosylhydrolase [Gammaproteobacteria bacterium]